MELEQALAAQLQAHPAMQPQDVIKLCYQAARGAEHLLADPDAAARWLRQEYEAVPADEAIPLAEEIGPESCRVNLAGWKAHGLPVEWLFGIFCASAAQQQGGEATLEESVALIQQKSRNYAKRQLTWFNKDARIHWIRYEKGAQLEELANIATTFLRP